MNKDASPPHSPELEGVEKPAIQWLQTLGYTHLSGKVVGRQQAHRHLPPILNEVLADRLLAFNPWLADIASGTETVLREIRKFWNNQLMEANQQCWESVIHGSAIQVKDNAGRLRSVRFFDQMSPLKNDFHVVDQFVGTNSDGDEFRPDLLLFINGLPLAMIECKASHVKVSKGINQLLSYQNSHPRHFVFNQVCVAINRNQALYGAIYTPESFYFRYRLEAAEEKEVRRLVSSASPDASDKQPTEQHRLLWALFEPSRFVELVCQFVLFELEEGRTIKKLPRYQQWRAVRKTIQRLTSPEPIGGVVWHTQGSGKSLTMAYLARYLRAECVGLNNPSVLVLTDRTDLDRQITNTFTHIGLTPIKAPSVAGLERMLSNDYGSVFTSTVQKFQERDSKPIKAAAKDAEADNEENRTRVRRMHEKGQFYICEDVNIHFGQRNAGRSHLALTFK